MYKFCSVLLLFVSSANAWVSRHSPVPLHNKNASIAIIGDHDLLVRALMAKFRGLGYTRVASAPAHEDRFQVAAFFEQHQPNYVFFVPPRYEQEPGVRIATCANFSTGYLRAILNVLELARVHGVSKLLFLFDYRVYTASVEKISQKRVENGVEAGIEAEFFSNFIFSDDSYFSFMQACGISLCQAFRNQFGMEIVVGVTGELCESIGLSSAEGLSMVRVLVEKIQRAKVSGMSSVKIFYPKEHLIQATDVFDCADSCIYAMRQLSGGAIVNLAATRHISVGAICDIVVKKIGYDGKILFCGGRGNERSLQDLSLIHCAGWSNVLEPEKIIKSLISNAILAS